jgi:flagellar basal body-associated protein FliL
MAKEVINVGGEDTVVREDTAKSYRGVIWALLSVGAFIIIGAIMFFLFFSGAVGDGDMQSPKQIEEKRQPNGGN